MASRYDIRKRVDGKFMLINTLYYIFNITDGDYQFLTPSENMNLRTQKRFKQGLEEGIQLKYIGIYINENGKEYTP